MRSSKLFIYLSFALVSLVYTACKTNEGIVNTDKKTMPKNFAGSKDSSTNSANIKWKDFFADKNLSALIDTALKNNFDVLMTLQKIEIAKNDLRLSKNAMLPAVNSNIAYLQRKFGYYTMDDAGNRTTEITPGHIIPTNLPDFYVGFQASWEVDIWGKLRNKKKAAFMRYLSTIEGMNWVITNLISEISTAYYELISLDNELDIIRETIKLQQDALEIMKVQKQAGVTTEVGVKQFAAQVLNSQSLEFETKQKITENENKINFLLGRFPQTIIRDKVNFIDQIPKQITSGIPSDLLRNRPDIRQAEFDLVATKFDVKAAKAAFYPSFNITAALGYESFKTQFLFLSPRSIAYNLLGNFVTPLVNRNAIKTQFNNAKANQIEAMYNYQKSIANGFVEVLNELSNINNLEAIHKLKTQEVAELVGSIDLSNDLFKSGRMNYFEVLMTQKLALQSRLDLVSTRKRQHFATINIYKALGGGWK